MSANYGPRSSGRYSARYCVNFRHAREKREESREQRVEGRGKYFTQPNPKRHLVNARVEQRLDLAR